MYHSPSQATDSLLPSMQVSLLGKRRLPYLSNDAHESLKKNFTVPLEQEMKSNEEIKENKQVETTNLSEKSINLKIIKNNIEKNDKDKTSIKVKFKKCIEKNRIQIQKATKDNEEFQAQIKTLEKFIKTLNNDNERLKKSLFLNKAKSIVLNNQISMLNERYRQMESTISLSIFGMETKGKTVN